MSPFHVFSKALGMDVLGESEHVSFAQALAVDRTGALLTRQGSEEKGGAFAGMLTAVQNFVKDSFGGADGALGRRQKYYM